MRHLILISMLMILSILCHAQEPREHKLFVGEFENRTGIVNPLLSYLSDTLSFLFSRSEADERFTLATGKHHLVLHNKDDGVRLDCVVLYRER